MKHIIFDLHQTLICKKKEYHEIIQEIISHEECVKTSKSQWEKYELCINEIRKKFNHKHFNLVDSKVYWIDFFNQSLQKSELNFSKSNIEIAEIIYTKLHDPKYWQFYPDVTDAINYLNDNNIAFGFLSNWDLRIEKIWEELSQSLNVENKLTVFSYQTGYCKPQKEIFEIYINKALKKNPNYEKFISLGDNPLTDSGGDSLGIPFYLVDRKNLDFNLKKLLKEVLKHG